MDRRTMNTFFPEIEPYSSGFLEVDDLHTLYWEQSGNPDGEPILFLHGGPGQGTMPIFRQFFDPDYFRIILFDQRGCGRSSPNACLTNNTRAHLVSDIEKLRKHFNIEQWHIFGGSWGSTLALSYAEQHANRCSSMILRGVSLLSKENIDWLINGMETFFPEAHEKFQDFIPKEEQKSLLKAYHQQLNSPYTETKQKAALNWSAYESACVSITPKPNTAPTKYEEIQAITAMASIQFHYFTHEVIADENSLLKRVDKFRHIPTSIIQGRYDAICPIKFVYRLHKAWPESNLIIVPDGGHSSLDPSILSALIDATESLKKDFTP
jgi:proline iminopeptidase